MSLEPLEERRRDILEAVVRAHILSGAPVSSAAIARRSGHQISPATIRNVMASLEAAGFLFQPHTSAGRIPTAKGFEFYAQEVAVTARLRPSDQKWINRNLASEEADAQARLTRVPHVLSVLCRGVGLVLVTPLAGTVLDQVRFVRLDDQRVLAVVVTRAGLVRDKVVATREHFRIEELERMGAYLNQHFRGWTLAAIRAEVDRRVAAERSQFLRQALTLCRESFDPADAPDDVHVEGMAHLVERAEAVSSETLRELLSALEEKERLARLLKDCLASPEPPVRIVIGLERLTPAMKDFAFIGARYGGGERPVGSLGLLGPTRMDYARTITAVAYVATLFDRLGMEN